MNMTHELRLVKTLNSFNLTFRMLQHTSSEATVI